VALLEVSEVVVRFGGVTAVDGASLTARRGQITGLIGPNGAGKTTLFNVISGLQAPQHGSVVFRGRDLRQMPPSGRSRGGVGRTFQRLEAFGSLTVRQNVLVAIEIRQGLRWMRSAAQRAEADRLLDLVGIAEYADHRADAVPTGVARLLEVARSLATEPRLLLLDEPSSGLIETETEKFGLLLRQLAEQKMAILMVEHDMGLVMGTCDYVYVLDFGKVIAAGTPAEVQADPRVQQAYLGTLDVA
jgi:branched-chain amino acid transport system ATP-binding protein